MRRQCFRPISIQRRGEQLRNVTLRTKLDGSATSRSLKNLIRRRTALTTRLNKERRISQRHSAPSCHLSKILNALPQQGDLTPSQTDLRLKPNHPRLKLGCRCPHLTESTPGQLTEFTPKSRHSTTEQRQQCPQSATSSGRRIKIAGHTFKCLTSTTQEPGSLQGRKSALQSTGRPLSLPRQRPASLSVSAQPLCLTFQPLSRVVQFIIQTPGLSHITSSTITINLQAFLCLLECCQLPLANRSLLLNISGQQLNALCLIPEPAPCTLRRPHLTILLLSQILKMKRPLLQHAIQRTCNHLRSQLT